MFGWLDKFLESRSVAKANRESNQPRAWLFVDAYGPGQARVQTLMTFTEALSFLKENVGKPYVESEIPRGIIFFDGRDKRSQN